MTTATRARKASKSEKQSEQKTVTFIARYALKATGSIVWNVRNGENKEYCVTLNANGTVGCYDKATGKECKGHTFAHNAGHECHHILACQKKEAERKEAAQAVEQVEEYIRQEIDENDKALVGLRSIQAKYDEAYEQWKRENGLSGQLSREAYVAEFRPNEW